MTDALMELAVVPDNGAGWSPSTLKEYTETQVYGLRRELEGHAREDSVRFEAIRQSTQIAADILKDRQERENNIREEMREANINYLSRHEYNSAHEMIRTQIAELCRMSALSEGKASQQSVNNAWIGMALSLAIALASLIHGFWK